MLPNQRVRCIRIPWVRLNSYIILSPVNHQYNRHEEPSPPFHPWRPAVLPEPLPAYGTHHPQ
jgi:hypothetical protein